MPIPAKDAAGLTVQIGSEGSGTTPDPYIPQSISLAPADTPYGLFNGVGQVIKSSPGRLNSFCLINSSSVNLWLQFFNATALPASGAAAFRVYPAYAGAAIFLDQDHWGRGLSFSTGIVWSLSSSLTTYNGTLGAASTLFLADGRYS